MGGSIGSRMCVFRRPTILAYVLGKRKDEVLKQLKTTLAVQYRRRCYTDDWSAYKRHLAPEKHEIGKVTPEN